MNQSQPCPTCERAAKQISDAAVVAVFALPRARAGCAGRRAENVAITAAALAGGGQQTARHLV